MLALALVLDGRTRGEAAGLCGMDRQTLRDWVHRYNTEGLAGLSDRPQPGPTPRLTAEQEAAMAALVRVGPELSEHGVIRWRRKDLARVIEHRYGVVLHDARAAVPCSGVWVFGACPCGPGTPATTRRHRRLSGRVRRPRSREPARRRARQAAGSLVPRRGPGGATGHADARVGRARLASARATRPALRMGLPVRRGLPRTRRRRRSRAALRQHGSDEPAPRRDQQAGHARGACRRRARRCRLAPERRQAGRARQPEPATLAPYAPELNPVENVWQYLRQNQLSNRVFESYDAIVHACCDAWNALVATPERIASIATRRWAKITA